MSQRKKGTHDTTLPQSAERSMSLEAKQRQLEGREPQQQQSALFDQSAVEQPERPTPTDLYEGEPETSIRDSAPDSTEQPDPLTEQVTREGETTDPYKAAEEGLTYIPPVDPPITTEMDMLHVPSNDLHQARIASGLAPSAFVESYDADHHSMPLPTADELTARVEEALRADSRTNRYTDRVTVMVRGATVIVRGTVDDLDDNDALLAVIRPVEGVSAVIDQLEVVAIT